MEYARSVIVLPATIWVVVAVLIIWALGSSGQAVRATARLTGSLSRARIRIAQETDPLQFAQRFEAISSDLLQFPYVGPRWRQYRETLVIPVHARSSSPCHRPRGAMVRPISVRGCRP